MWIKSLEFVKIRGIYASPLKNISSVKKMRLKVVRTHSGWKIRNSQKNVTYKTLYSTKMAAERKMRIMEAWFFRNNK